MFFRLLYLIALVLILPTVIVFIIKNHFQNIYHIDYKKHFSYINNNNKLVVIKDTIPFDANAEKIYNGFFSKYCFIDFENFILVINKFTSKSINLQNQADMDEKLLKIYIGYKDREKIWQ